MKFFQQRTSELTAVGSNVTFEADELYRGVHQVTIATFDSSGDPATATAGTFGIEYKGSPIAVAEILKDSSGSAVSIDATELESYLFEGNAEEITIIPSLIGTATHYRVTLTQGE